ncbi:acyl-CoA thioesterase [Gemmatimonas groenlandica]|uniref:Acyl-CoA thioesterase n=1 Tax=Gemmatimonas groenlandica TaxID=2732249 RepID=A0A6M4IXF8_9BACT|nr:acyl-CoA thioesterase [Gemmatimonas groenlandica]
MIHYWFTIVKILALRHVQPSVAPDATIRRTFRVRLFDCDGFRVMTASRYAAYMDFIRWEMIARSPMYHAIVTRGLAPTLGSQKLIYRKPLKRWTQFEVELELAGWDDKWIYHIHRFVQHGEIKAVGITRALIWKRDVPSVLADVLRDSGVTRPVMNPPGWVFELFAQDKEIIDRQRAAASAS